MTVALAHMCTVTILLWLDDLGLLALVLETPLLRE